MGRFPKKKIEPAAWAGLWDSKKFLGLLQVAHVAWNTMHNMCIILPTPSGITYSTALNWFSEEVSVTHQQRPLGTVGHPTGQPPPKPDVCEQSTASWTTFHTLFDRCVGSCTSPPSFYPYQRRLLSLPICGCHLQRQHLLLTRSYLKTLVLGPAGVSSLTGVKCSTNWSSQPVGS